MFVQASSDTICTQHNTPPLSFPARLPAHAFSPTPTLTTTPSFMKCHNPPLHSLIRIYTFLRLSFSLSPGHTGNVNICTVSDYKMRKVYCDPYYHPISSIKNYISHATETVTSSDSTSTSSSEHHIDSPEREICSYKVYWHVTWLRDFRPTTNSDLDQWQSLYEKEKEQEKKLSQTQNAPGKASKSQITTGIIAGEEYVTYAEALAAAREHNTHKSGLCRIAMATHARTSWFDEEAERQQYGLVLLWSLMSGVMTLFFSVAVICLYRRSTLEAFKKLSYSQWDRNSPSPRHGPFASPIKSPMSGALPSPMLHAHVHAHAHGHARSPSTRRSPYSTPMKAGGYLPANRGSPSSFSLSEVTTQLSGLSVINISSSPPRNSISTQRDTSQ